MTSCIWYISKYLAPRTENSEGGRGYLLMRELAKLGHKCIIITSDSNNLVEVPALKKSVVTQKIDGLEIIWLRTLKYAVAKSARRILSWFDFELKLARLNKSTLPRPDAIVISSLSLLTIINGLILRRKYGCRIIFEIRDIWPLTITEEGGYKKTNPLVALLAYVEKLGYTHSDAIVGTMPNLKEHVKNITGKERPVFCIPMGVDENMLTTKTPIPANYKKDYIPSGKFIIVHAGTIGITNALDTFLDCAKTFGSRPEIHFLVVGDGDLRQHYQEKYAEFSNISFAPKVKKSQVQAVLEECDLLYFSVHPSNVWSYGQSLNKVIDYMMSGKPIVASYTGYPSMINEAECGSYVPAGNIDALRSEIEKYFSMLPIQRETVGKRGRTWLVKNRMYKELARQYYDILVPSQFRPEKS